MKLTNFIRTIGPLSMAFIVTMISISLTGCKGCKYHTTEYMRFSNETSESVLIEVWTPENSKADGVPELFNELVEPGQTVNIEVGDYYFYRASKGIPIHEEFCGNRDREIARYFPRGRYPASFVQNYLICEPENDVVLTDSPHESVISIRELGSSCDRNQVRSMNIYRDDG